MISSKYYQFQDDLRRGISIQEALTRHGLSFRDAFLHLQYKNKPSCNKNGGKNRYLLIRRGRSVQVRKSIDGKQRVFGSYRNIQDARKVRNYLERNDWKCDDLEKLQELLGVHHL